ncbi:MerR family transcriptional regulator [Paenibacillus agilis]|uniref:MerR family transcriptional regulator n=1 Tax=Paenibacillus agilis TaxID=3020863 RepID=UPI0021BD6B7E|nr:MerR family transcriptional regulator [Paenibacillus agilis]
MRTDGDNQLLRIGELARLASVNQRTIDYYTSLGLIEPTKRTDTNYRLYHMETIERLQRIIQMKQEKYTLDEIKEYFSQLQQVSIDEQLVKRLTDLQVHLQQVEREAKELQPILDKLKPTQAKSLFQRIAPQSAACIDVLIALADKQHML